MSFNPSSVSLLDVLKHGILPSNGQNLAAKEIFTKLHDARVGMEKTDPLLQLLKLKRHWMPSLNSRQEIIPTLAYLLSKKVPPIVAFKYNPKIVQISQDGIHWSPAKTSLLTMPTWHAVVLQKIEIKKINENTNETYLVFRDSANSGTVEKPTASHIRIRASDSIDLINQILSVTGPWDQIDQ